MIFREAWKKLLARTVTPVSQTNVLRMTATVAAKCNLDFHPTLMTIHALLNPQGQSTPAGLKFKVAKENERFERERKCFGDNCLFCQNSNRDRYVCLTCGKLAAIFSLHASPASHQQTRSSTDIFQVNLEKLVLNCSREDASTQRQPTQPPDNLPSSEKLHLVFENITEHLPKFFESRVNVDFWKYHSRDILLIDNIRGKRVQGLNKYALCCLWIRFLMHAKFGYVKLDLLQCSEHVDEGSVKVRWRIRGLPGLKVFYNFWKFRIGMDAGRMQEHEQWYDGFSTFYVNSDGKIQVHVADKIVPDSPEEVEKQARSLTSRLAALFGQQQAPVATTTKFVKPALPNLDQGFSRLSRTFSQL